MSLLDAEIATLFGSVFGGIYLDGTLSRRALTQDGVGGFTTSTTDEACKVQIDACTERQKLELGYSPKDVRLLILSSGISGVSNGDKVTVKSKTWSIGPVVAQDPAASYYEARGVAA